MPNDDALTKAMAALSPVEAQQLHQALYAIKFNPKDPSGKPFVPGIDPSKFDSAKVDRAWTAIQPVISKAPPASPVASGAREATLGVFGGMGVPETQSPITDLAKGIYHTAGVMMGAGTWTGQTSAMDVIKATPPGMAVTLAKQAATDVYGGGTHGGINPNTQEVLHGIGTAAGALLGAKILGGGHGDEIPGGEVTRTTPISETGKEAAPGSSRGPLPSSQPVASGSISKNVLPEVAIPPTKISTLKGAPETRYVPPVDRPFVQVREAQLAQKAAEVQAAPNPMAGKFTKADKIQAQAAPPRPEWTAGQLDNEISRTSGILNNPAATPEERGVAQAQLANYRELAGGKPPVAEPSPATSLGTPAKALPEPPLRPSGRPTPGDPIWQQYAADRSTWRKQVRDAGLNPDTMKPLATKPALDTAGRIDQSVERFVKSRNADDMAVRKGELQGHLATVSVADAPSLASTLRDRAATADAQAAELNRTAAAPAAIAQLAEGAKGGKLFGDWERHVPSEEQVNEAGARGEAPPRTKVVDVSGKSPAERDLFHEMLGHGTARVISRDELGQPKQLELGLDEAGASEAIGKWKGELQGMLEDWKARGLAPTPEELEHAQTLKGFIEDYGGTRDRLAFEKGQPRKGLPELDERGVVRAPGAIPDIGRTTGNALLGRPENSHLTKPDAARLSKEADRWSVRAATYRALAKSLEERTHVDLPTQPRVSEQLPTIRVKTPEAAGDGVRVAPTPPKSAVEGILAKAEATPNRFSISMPEAPKVVPEAQVGEGQVRLRRYNERGELVGEEAIAKPAVNIQETPGSQALHEALDKGDMRNEMARIDRALQKSGLTKSEQSRLEATRETYERALRPAEISDEMDHQARDLFSKPFAELTKKQKFVVNQALSGLQEMLKTAKEAVPVEQVELKAPFSAGFPMGEVSEAVRQSIDGLHAMMEKMGGREGADMIAAAVRDQGLGTREGAFKLYGKALARYLEGKGDPLALRKALDIATRASEKGAIHANFLGNLAVGFRSYLKSLDLSSENLGKQSFRELAARRSQYLNHADWLMSGMRKHFNKMPLDDQFQFQKDIQSGAWKNKFAPGSKEYKFAEFGRLMLDANRAEIRGIRPDLLRKFDENYFPQRWQGIHSLDEYASRIFKGNSAALRKGNFLKERYHQGLQAGVDAGLKPVHYNPADAIMRVIAEGQHFIMGQKWIDETVARGDMMRNPRSPRAVPAGWAMLDARVAGHGVYGPAELKTLFDKRFDPGLFGRKNALDAVKLYNSTAQQAAVSLSGFHFLTTGWAAWTGDLQMGVQYLAHDPVKAAKAFGRFATFGLKDLVNGYQFDKYLRETPGHQLTGIFDAYMKGGGQTRGDESFTDMRAIQNLRRSYKELTQAPLGATPVDRLRAAKNMARDIIPATLRTAAYPIQDLWVRPLKLGSTMKALELELDRLGPGASNAEQRTAYGRVVNDMDDRFGQVIQDNRFWSKTVRDSLGLGFKFFDWNFGTIRGMYGAAKDVPRAAMGVGVTQRLAFALAAPVTWAIMGSVLNYALTGEPPKDMSDMFDPRNGRLDSNGHPERLSSNGYLRAAQQWSAPVTKLAQGNLSGALKSGVDASLTRLSPVVDLVRDLYSNRDFTGDQIVNKNDPLVSQVGQLVKGMMNQFQPISISSAARSEQLEAGRLGTVLSYAGLQPLPRSLSPDITPAEAELSEQLRTIHGAGLAAPEELAHQRAINRLVISELNHTGDFGRIWQQESQAGHLHTVPNAAGRTDMDTVLDRLSKPFMARVSELPLARAVSVLEKAQTPLERMEVMQAITPKMDQLLDMAPAERQKLWTRLLTAQRRPLGTHP